MKAQRTLVSVIRIRISLFTLESSDVLIHVYLRLENESQAQAPENPTPNEMAPAPSSEPESKRSAAPDEEDLISFD